MAIWHNKKGDYQLMYEEKIDLVNKSPYITCVRHHKPKGFYLQAEKSSGLAQYCKTSMK
jgi:hypothetical protein